jgi:hypothetical protein
MRGMRRRLLLTTTGFCRRRPQCLKRDTVIAPVAHAAKCKTHITKSQTGGAASETGFETGFETGLGLRWEGYGYP